MKKKQRTKAKEKEIATGATATTCQILFLIQMTIEDEEHAVDDAFAQHKYKARNLSAKQGIDPDVVPAERWIAIPKGKGRK